MIKKSVFFSSFLTILDIMSGYSHSHRKSSSLVTSYSSDNEEEIVSLHEENFGSSDEDSESEKSKISRKVTG